MSHALVTLRDVRVNLGGDLGPKSDYCASKTEFPPTIVAAAPQLIVFEVGSVIFELVGHPA